MTNITVLILPVSPGFKLGFKLNLLCAFSIISIGNLKKNEDLKRVKKFNQKPEGRHLI